jgi:hypothetical protein
MTQVSYVVVSPQFRLLIMILPDQLTILFLFVQSYPLTCLKMVKV